MALEDLDIDSWNQNRKLVLNRLESIAAQVAVLDAKIGTDLVNMKIDVATMKTKMAIYVGAVGAVVSAIVAIVTAVIVTFLTKGR